MKGIDPTLPSYILVNFEHATEVPAEAFFQALAAKLSSNLDHALGSAELLPRDHALGSAELLPRDHVLVAEGSRLSAVLVNRNSTVSNR